MGKTVIEERISIEKTKLELWRVLLSKSSYSRSAAIRVGDEIEKVILNHELESI